jgi:hypothetical protein
MSEDFEKEIEELRPTTPEEAAIKQKVEEKQAIDRIVRGVNDTFIKRYDIDDLDLHFTIKIKAPNALDIGKIQARLAAYLGGMNVYASDYMLEVFNTLATIRTTGVEVPKCLEKDEEIYNLDVLYMIGRDFRDWLNTFRL